MATKELTIAVLLAIVIGSNSGSYSNNNYDLNYAQRPVFMFRPKLPESPPKPITLADLIALFDATGYTGAAWNSAGTVISSGQAAVKAALGSYPANAHAALQALANAPPGVAQQFFSLGNQFTRMYFSLIVGVNYLLPELFTSIEDTINDANGVNDPVAIQKLTDLFDVLHYLATVLLNFKLQVSSKTDETVKQNIANIHSTMAVFLDQMNHQMATVVSFSLPKEKIISSLQLIRSKVMQFELKPCSLTECVDLSQLLPDVKRRAQDALDLYQS